MVLLDTDTLTALLRGHPGVQKRIRLAETNIATTVVTWMEVLPGRFQAIFSAADSDQLERASRRLEGSYFVPDPCIWYDELRLVERFGARKPPIVGRLSRLGVELAP
jgi:predicted nucleic acid-binding protein